MELSWGDDIVYTGNGKPALKQLMDRYYETGSCQIIPEGKVFAHRIIQGERTEILDLLKVVDMIEKPTIKEAHSRFAALLSVKFYSVGKFFQKQ